MEFLYDFSKILLATCRDVLPIIVLICVFQLLVLRQSIPHLGRLVVGGVYVVVGLALFLAGLEKALFPLGKIMAKQLSDPFFIYGSHEINYSGRLEGLWLGVSFWGHDWLCNHHCRAISYCRGT